jgi:flagellar basal body P-ring protein FlgI
MLRRLMMWGSLCLLAVCLTGCVTPPPFFPRAKTDDDVQRDRDLDVRTIGEVTEVTNANPWQVSGVGLVVGLNGTGGTPPGRWREFLEQELRKRKVEHIKSLLDSPDNALVLVNGFMHPGIRKGELFDLEVTLPEGSKVTSLKGGYLQETFLKNFQNTGSINPDKAGTLLGGHVLARAQGNLMVGLGAQDEPSEWRRARIWQGAVSLVERPFYFALTKNEKSARVAGAVAERINLMFHDDPKKQKVVLDNQRLMLTGEVTEQLNAAYQASSGRSHMAKAITPEIITVSVPYAYRYNPERYLRVARLIPLREDPVQLTKYRQRLGKMLLVPADAARAALRLEALGKESVPLLKAGLESKEPFVRFAAAEALTYLGVTAGIEELAALSMQHPPLRAYAILALASLDESICRTKLTEMMHHDDPQLRVGAFGALRLLLTDDLEANVFSKNIDRLRKQHEQRLRELGGENLEQFWVHRVAPNSAPLVQYAVARRPEVLLFGKNIRLVGPVSILIGKEYSITSEPGMDKLVLARVTEDGPVRAESTMELHDALRALASLGAHYPDIVEFLRNVEADRALNCPIGMTQTPAILPLEELIELGKDAKSFATK